MTTNRRRFLQGAVATSGAAAFAAGAALSPKVEQEMGERLRYLSPPDGVPLALEVLPSPVAEPFKDELYVPDDALPLLDMSGPDYVDLSPGDWQARFEEAFNTLATTLRAEHDIDIGEPPVPEAHQRFWEFRPQKLFVIREREFAWGYHTDYCGGDAACEAVTTQATYAPTRSKGYLLDDELVDDSVKRKGVSYTWGFESIGFDRNGTLRRHTGSPGPTFKARYGQPILVRRINDLPEIGNNRRGHSRLAFALPSTTTHLHNAHTASESDGFPNDWINPGEYWDHHYGNFPQGYDEREKLTTLWYHDHRMDFTAANVYAGLDGFYLLFDDDDTGDETNESGWRLPSGKYDVPMILHDLYFNEDENETPQLAFDGFNTDGILGDRFTVNRTIQPRLEVERRKYRLRLLNGGPSRFYELVLYTDDGPLEERYGDGTSRPFIIITGDGNFQPNPLLAPSLYIGVAQRVDVIVDFSEFDVGDHVYLVNQLEQINGRGPTERRLEPRNRDVEAFVNTNAVLRFDVIGSPRDGTDQSRFPFLFRDLPPVDLSEVKRHREWEFDYDGGLWTINGKTYDPDRVDAGIEQDSAEIWTFRNTGNSWHHPIHSHFTEFIVLETNNRLVYQGQVQTDGKGDEFAQVFNTVEQLRARFEEFSSIAFDQAPSAYAKGSDPDREYPWDVVDDEGRLANRRKITSKLRRAYGKRDRARGEQAVEAFENLVKLPHQTIDKILELRFDEIQFDSYARYALWTRFYPLFGLGDVRLDDAFMGGPRRDVALILPNWEVKVFMRWKDFVGKHVMHCHNVVHEDHAMMIRWEIFPRGEGFDTPTDQHETSQVDDPVEPERIPHVETHPRTAVKAENGGRK